MAHELIKSPIAKNGDRRELLASPDAEAPQRANNAEGFPEACQPAKTAGGIPMDREDHNQALYLASNNLFEMQNGNLPQYSAEVAALIGGYPKNAVLWDQSRGFIRSYSANNTNPPNGYGWEELCLKPGALDGKLNADFSNISDGRTAAMNMRLRGSSCAVVATGSTPAGQYRYYVDGSVDMWGIVPQCRQTSGIEGFDVDIPCPVLDGIMNQEYSYYYPGTEKFGETKTLGFLGLKMIYQPDDPDPTRLRVFAGAGVSRAMWKITCKTEGVMVYTSHSLSDYSSGGILRDIGGFTTQPGLYRIHLRGGSGRETRTDLGKYGYPGGRALVLLDGAGNKEVVFRRILGNYNNGSGTGAGIAMLVNGEVAVAVGGGASLEYSSSTGVWTGYGGSGYNGGRIGAGVSAAYPGYNINGTTADLGTPSASGLDGESGNGGGSITAGGGIGYINPDMQNKIMIAIAEAHIADYAPGLVYAAKEL